MQVAFSGVSRQAAARRLRKLLDAGYLRVEVPERAGPNIYLLGAIGKTWARQHGLEPGRAPRGLGQHHLDTVTTWVAIAAAAREFSWRLRFCPEWELRRQLTTGVIPDALVTFAWPCPSGELHHLPLVLEVDRGSESGTTLKGKLERLGLLACSGGFGEGWDDPVLGVAAFGASERRLQTIRSLLDETWTGPTELWTDSEGPRVAFEDLRATVATKCCSGGNREGAASDVLPTASETGHPGYSEEEDLTTDRATDE
jgi:hypothetical protein